MIATSQLPEQPNLIPGIYNYCDSWCERCQLSTRCRSFQLQQQANLITPSDPNASLVEQMTEALDLTKKYIETLQKNAPSAPEGLSSADQLTLEEAVLSRRHQIKEHPAATLATAYLKQTGAWLSEEKSLLGRAGQQQVEEVNLGIRTEAEAMEQLTALKDAYDQIRWYRTLIPVKTKAALRAIEEATHDDYLLAYYNGKAKLMLVSIDQSLASWQTVMAYYPEKIDDLLDMLSLLNQLTRQIETIFPNARSFRRPGLD